jgi:hypothetical protein
MNRFFGRSRLACCATPSPSKFFTKFCKAFNASRAGTRQASGRSGRLRDFFNEGPVIEVRRCEGGASQKTPQRIATPKEGIAQIIVAIEVSFIGADQQSSVKIWCLACTLQMQVDEGKISQRHDVAVNLSAASPRYGDIDQRDNQLLRPLFTVPRPGWMTPPGFFIGHALNFFLSTLDSPLTTILVLHTAILRRRIRLSQFCPAIPHSAACANRRWPNREALELVARYLDKQNRET